MNFENQNGFFPGDMTGQSSSATGGGMGTHVPSGTEAPVWLLIVWSVINTLNDWFAWLLMFASTERQAVLGLLMALFITALAIARCVRNHELQKRYQLHRRTIAEEKRRLKNE